MTQTIRPRGKGVSSLLNIFLVVLSTFLCILLAEYALRVFPQFYDNIPVKIRASEFSSYSMVPNQTVLSTHGNKFEINSLGLRDKEIDPPYGEIFALVAGDSSTLGYGVQEWERFSSLISEEISQNPSKLHDIGCQDCESKRVLNAGHAGYQAGDNVGMINHLLGLGIRPRLLIIGIMQNDFQKPSNYTIVDGSQESVVRPILSRIEKSIKSILRNSALYQFVGNKIKGTRRARAKARDAKDQVSPDNPQELSDIQSIQLTAYRNLVAEFSKSNPNTPLIFAYIPETLDLDRDLGLAMSLLKEETENYNCSSFIDTRAQLLNSDYSKTELYALNDPLHPSDVGHEIIAKTIFDQIAKSFESCVHSGQ